MSMAKRKESFTIFTKSFKKKLSNFEGKKVLFYDLKDIEKVEEQIKIKYKNLKKNLK